MVVAAALALQARGAAELGVEDDQRVVERELARIGLARRVDDREQAGEQVVEVGRGVAALWTWVS